MNLEILMYQYQEMTGVPVIFSGGFVMERNGNGKVYSAVEFTDLVHKFFM